jgi:large subunit ribosomal protein L9
MDVILLEDVEKVGLRGEVVHVARGYARNFLLPRRLAEPATPGRVAEVRRIEERRALQQARTHEQGEAIAAQLASAELRFDVKSGPTGSLFGSVTPTDIADALWETQKVRVDRRKIQIDAIKRIGRYAVAIDLFEGVTAEVRTLVVPEGGELPPEEELEAMEAAAAAEEAASAEVLADEEILEEVLAAEEAEVALEDEDGAAEPDDQAETALEQGDESILATEREIEH